MFCKECLGTGWVGYDHCSACGTEGGTSSFYGDTDYQEALHAVGTLLQSYANKAERMADEEALDNIEGVMDNLEALILEQDAVLHAALVMGMKDTKEDLTRERNGDIVLKESS